MIRPSPRRRFPTLLFTSVVILALAGGTLISRTNVPLWGQLLPPAPPTNCSACTMGSGCQQCGSVDGVCAVHSKLPGQYECFMKDQLLTGWKSCPCPPVSSCGNGQCDIGEASECPLCAYATPPCSAPCREGSCPNDCLDACNHDGTCNANLGETPINCAQDCRPPCSPPPCLAPPAGCHYVDPVYDNNQCMTSCGKLECPKGSCAPCTAGGGCQKCANGNETCVVNASLPGQFECFGQSQMPPEWSSCACPPNPPVCNNNDRCDSAAGETTANCPKDCATTPPNCPDSPLCFSPPAGCEAVDQIFDNNHCIVSCGSIECKTSCGNGKCDAGEADDCICGPNGDDPNCKAPCRQGTCPRDCETTPLCGNKKIDSGEECDPTAETLIAQCSPNGLCGKDCRCLRCSAPTPPPCSGILLPQIGADANGCALPPICCDAGQNKQCITSMNCTNGSCRIDSCTCGTACKDPTTPACQGGILLPQLGPDSNGCKLPPICCAGALSGKQCSTHMSCANGSCLLDSCTCS